MGAAEAKLSSKIAELKQNWKALELETLKKRRFTEAEWRTLARYSLDPHDNEALRALPIKLASFTGKTRKIVLEFAERQQSIVRLRTLRKKKNKKRFKRLPKKVRRLAKGIDRDFRAVAEAFFQSGRKKNRTEIDAGMYNRARAGGDLHTDGSGSDSSAIIGRINLSFHYIDGETMATASPRTRRKIEAVKKASKNPVKDLHGKVVLSRAENGGAYLLAIGEQGILHCSHPVLKPAPSLFARLFCG